MLRRKVQSEMPVDQEWIPAFTGMTVVAAAMTMSMASFPRERE